MNRFWLKSYPPGVPDDIDMGDFQSIVDFLENASAEFPENCAFSNFGVGLNFTEIRDSSIQFGAYLQQELGLKKGDRFAIMLPNLLQYPIALFAALRVGLTVVNVDPMYTSRELIHQLKNANVKALLYLENFGLVVESSLPETKVKHLIKTTVGEMLPFPKGILINLVLKHVKHLVPKNNIQNAVTFKQALQIGNNQDCVDADVKLDDFAFLQYTGGTTGVSKGAILTHKNIIANVLQATAWAGTDLVRGKEKAITALPLYHIFSMTANMLFMMSAGSENILITNPRDFESFVKFLKNTQFSVFVGVNTLFRKLLNTKGFADIDFSSLKLTMGGGMSVTDDVARDWLAITNSVVVEAYGLTETSPAVCINPLTVKEFTGKIGLPISSTEVQIKDDEGNDVGINVQGELCVKGPQVTQGYWQREDANEYAFSKDGFFRTGDFALIDEAGYVQILDRKKDMILVSGFNVFPNEIENVISQHSKVLEAAAIGIPHEESGQVVKLFVVKSGAITEAEILTYCKENLTGYKCPKEIIFLDELPKTNVGKILRKDLR